jgi:hypothetical protein
VHQYKHRAIYLLSRAGGGGAYLERLGVPVLDPLDRGHVAEAIGELLELLDTVGQADGQLFGQEL